MTLGETKKTAAVVVALLGSVTIGGLGVVMTRDSGDSRAVSIAKQEKPRRVEVHTDLVHFGETLPEFAQKAGPVVRAVATEKSYEDNVLGGSQGRYEVQNERLKAVPEAQAFKIESLFNGQGLQRAVEMINQAGGRS